MTAAKVVQTISEKDWQSRVVDYARLRKWLVVHIRPARIGSTWAVPYEGDPGLPDLVMARDGKVILAELKSQTGRATPMQILWLRHSGGYLWKPSQWDEVVEVLR